MLQLYLVCAAAVVGSAHGTATFSGTLKSIGMSKFERETANMSPALKRIALLARQGTLDSMVMVFDESGSITAGHFQTAKAFAHNVINSETSWNGLNLEMGVVRFGTRATAVLGLTTTPNVAHQAVNNMLYGNAPSTNIAEAMKLDDAEASAVLLTYIMQYSRGQKLILLWTDGRHNTAGNPVMVASQLKAQGVCIIVVAIGPNVDNAQLAQIDGCQLAPALIESNLGVVSKTCQPGGMLINTNFAEIESNVGAFMNRVQSTFQAGAQCA